MLQLIYKTIYSPVVNPLLRSVNKFLQPILPSRIRLSPSGTITLKNDAGKQLKIKTNQTSYLAHLLYWEGYQNFEYTDIFTPLIKKVQVFYDIGANIGYYSLLAAMENPEIKVVGFEPASGPLFYFKKNVQLNHFDNIAVEPVALSHVEGEIVFQEVQNKKYRYLTHNLAGESNAGVKTDRRHFVSVNVKTTTLDQYVQYKKETQIDLIKMDTEGTENLILENAANVLSKMKPIIICETLFNGIEPELEAIMRSHQYCFYNHTPHGLKKVETIIRQKDDGVRNCFFVHPDKLELIRDFIQ